MTDMEQLKYDLKLLIIEACEKEQSVDDISDDETLFGEDTLLQLDSMDALQISMAIGTTYGIKMTDSKRLRKVMSSIETLAQFIQSVK